MNDRFKYRLWDKSINQMSYKVCIGFIDDGKGTQDWVCADTTCGQINYRDNKLKDIVLMQCTGLKDKNGKLIYEGDILEGYINVDISPINSKSVLKRGLIKIHNDMFVATCQDMKENCTLFTQLYWCKTEVIGNIYENPELLEGAEV